MLHSFNNIKPRLRNHRAERDHHNQDGQLAQQALITGEGTSTAQEEGDYRSSAVATRNMSHRQTLCLNWHGVLKAANATLCKRVLYCTAVSGMQLDLHTRSISLRYVRW